MRRLLLLFTLCCSGSLIAQNLVKNPSFEQYEECPNSLGTFHEHVSHWTTPTQGSTDYFNSCSAVMGAPENFNGIQHPKVGNAYAGIYFYAPGDYREYVQVSLTRKLRKGETYELTFYLSLAEGSDFAVKDFGVVLGYQPFQLNTRKNLSKGKLYQSKGNQFQSFEINLEEFHEDKSTWLLVKTEFEAKGFERYLVLGNLRDNRTTRKVQTKRKESKKGAYYYLDMVSLKSNSTTKNKEIEVKKDSLYVFKNVQFDFDVFHLTPRASTELAEVLKQLETHPELHLQLHGHTDNEGRDDYNKRLSEKRASTIANYFLEAGVQESRISWEGHGSSKPLATNATEEGRAQNRRVEFLFYQPQF